MLVEFGKDENIKSIKAKMLCLATGEIFEDITLSEYENPVLVGNWVLVQQHGKDIIVNQDFIISVEFI